MKKILLVIAIALLIFACDRFEHEVYENENIEEMMTTFTQALQTSEVDSLDTILDFYHPNYLNDAFAKTNMQDKFINFLNNYDSLSIEIDSYFQDLSINWTLYGAEISDSKGIEKIESFSDFLIKEGSQYFFYGNQVSAAPEYDGTKPMIIAQFSSATTCGNCPPAASKLDELKRIYGDQFIYLEYLYDGPDFANVFLPFVQYYSMNSQPSTMFQGQFVAAGGSSEIISSYMSKYEQSAQAEKLIHLNLSDINYSAE
ncbi:MAG: hypothetical protein U9N34_05380, partial [Candidatus Cloacimonadota bacterium]|nr:hypothetical protein [Candidatus Cloacimonadota bacterium]